jgi:hypothetical protein
MQNRLTGQFQSASLSRKLVALPLPTNDKFSSSGLDFLSPRLRMSGCLPQRRSLGPPMALAAQVGAACPARPRARGCSTWLEIPPQVSAQASQAQGPGSGETVHAHCGARKLTYSPQQSTYDCGHQIRARSLGATVAQPFVEPCHRGIIAAEPCPRELRREFLPGVAGSCLPPVCSRLRWRSSMVPR